MKQKNSTFLSRRTRYILVVVFTIIISLLSVHSRWAGMIDRSIYDIFLSRIPSQDPAGTTISIIDIDDESLEAIDEPLVFLVGDLATVLNALAAAGAKAVVLDILPAVSLHAIAPEKDAALMEAISRALSSGTKVIFGFRASKTAPEMPHQKFLYVRPRPPELGFLDLDNDKDGIIRKQNIYFSQEYSDKNASIALRTAMAIRENEISPDGFLRNEVYGSGELPPVVSLWIDYRLVQGQIERHSFFTILQNAREGNREALTDMFGGKVIMIGATAKKLSDYHITPFHPIRRDEKYTPGIIIHTATALSIISPFHFTNGPAFFSVWGTAFISISACLLLFVLPPVRAILILAGMFVLGMSALGSAFYFYHNIPASPLIFGIVVSAATSLSYIYSVEHRQHRILRRYFKSYVNNHVLKEILEHPENINFEGQHVTVSVMFADIRNFTSICERLKPSEVITGLNRYLSAMTNAIISHNGCVNRYIGDGIQAYFGSPNKLPFNGALAAIQGGLEMLKKLEELNKYELFPGTEKIKIGIGIHTGEGIVGNIGNQEKMAYDIVGDTPNLAARIEDLTKIYDMPLLVTDATYQLVHNYVAAEPVDTVTIKGRKQHVTIYRVKSLSN